MSILDNARLDFGEKLLDIFFLSICRIYESKIMKSFEGENENREKFSLRFYCQKLLRKLNKRWVSEGQTFIQ